MNLTTPVTFVVGENGSGKSTLVEAIAVGSGFNAEGGTRQVTFSTMNTESELHHWLTVVRAKNPTWGFFLRAESYYNVATAYYEFDATLPPEDRLNLHHRSHGESVAFSSDRGQTRRCLPRRTVMSRRCGRRLGARLRYPSMRKVAECSASPPCSGRCPRHARWRPP